MLTDKEIDVITDKQWDGIRGREIAAAHRAYARAIIAATVAKLSQGVSVEPSNWYENELPIYTANQLNANIAAARVQEKERIATEFDDLYTFGGDEIGKAIRALKEAT